MFRIQRKWHEQPLTLADGERICLHVFEYLQGQHFYSYIGAYDSIVSVRRALAQVSMEKYRRTDVLLQRIDQE